MIHLQNEEWLVDNGNVLEVKLPCKADWPSSGQARVKCGDGSYKGSHDAVGGVNMFM